LFAIGVVWLDTDVVAQVVHDGFGGTDFLHHLTSANWTAGLPCPLGEFFLDVMKLLVEFSHRGADRFAIALMLFRVNVFRVLQRAGPSTTRLVPFPNDLINHRTGRSRRTESELVAGQREFAQAVN
jgi:hypothetical protein